MIKFFRRIRQQLLTEKLPTGQVGKFSKYLIYALGEIFLVVIGILIALQINNWNTQRLNSIKEERILLEIKDNLKEDLHNIEFVLNKNAIKIKVIDTAFYYLSQINEVPYMAREFGNLMPILTNYDLFRPTRVAFDNMLSSGNTDILLSDELRKGISRYYSNDVLDGIQDQLIITTQGFLNEAAPKMINKAMIKSVTKLDFDIRALKAIAIHKDPYMISDLFVMQNKTIQHNRILNRRATESEELIASIERYLDTK